MTPRTLPLLALLASAPAWAHGGPPSGQVLVINDSGTTVRVELAGLPSRPLQAGERFVFETKPGEATVTATYTVFGERQVLETERAVVKPHRTSVIVIDPEDHAHVLVTNATRFDADLVVDGQRLGFLEAGESEVVSVEIGRASLELVATNGRMLGCTTLTTRAYREHTWTVEPPPTGFVVVDSDARFGTRVLVDGRPAGTLAPYGDVRLELAVGWHEIEVTDDRGRVIEETWVEVDPYSVREIEVDRDHTRPGGAVAWAEDDHQGHERPHRH
jgi:hypothetical protein